MRKRLRKKKRVGEFQELGFQLSFHYESGTVQQDNALLDAFIEEAIEGHGLQFGGGGSGGRWSGFAVPNEPYTAATDDQRERVRAWLHARPEVTSVRIGRLRDAWYGW